ncbi:MAG: Purine nucleoside phosphorylase DeoD-type [Pseudidiomarina mangrovi]|nr:MAG: Purine nucleoside phosphorylase DeoD-type [Pseudidiomarina mangrovi]
MSTPHIDAKPGDFADLCLLPGDPLRAKFIADRYLQQVQQVNTVRNMFGYTGYYGERRVSVMGTGMGMPSCAIYAHELVNHFGVKKLIRIGSCGAIDDRVQLFDVILAQGASTDSNSNRLCFGGQDFAALADFELLRQAHQFAQLQQLPVRVGNVFSTDLFYHTDDQQLQRLQQFGILAVEMEAAALYRVAAQHGAQALTILTVSDHIARDQHLDAEQRQRGFSTMIELALQLTEAD